MKVENKESGKMEIKKLIGKKYIDKSDSKTTGCIIELSHIEERGHNTRLWVKIVENKNVKKEKSEFYDVSIGKEYHLSKNEFIHHIKLNNFRLIKNKVKKL